MISCSLFTFLEYLLNYTPNWIMLIIVWEQIIRYILHRSYTTHILLTDFNCSLSHTKYQHCFNIINNQLNEKYTNQLNIEQPKSKQHWTLTTKQFHVDNLNELTINNNTMNTKSLIELNKPNNINNEKLIDGGLTLFGAKLITITIIVLQTFLNVHLIWLHNYSNGKCEIDVEKHSSIFTHYYPYLLQVSDYYVITLI
ncbi:hypothetical protein EWB00_000326 [Schistosoma japonicum]|uniref:Uncharacterized protein n=1 Tax=Schistosoma japonicum TaxID=6182 RepID=A0A4Z2DY76_SCHJA|nr:hypothetical protein EWB00_000326 [Schistosoma japonicum]